MSNNDKMSRQPTERSERTILIAKIIMAAALFGVIGFMLSSGELCFPFGSPAWKNVAGMWCLIIGCAAAQVAAKLPLP